MTSTDRGFTLVELIMAMAITVTMGSAVFAVLDPAGAIFQTQPELADVQQRLRVAAEALQRDIGAAGAGVGANTASGAARGDMADAFAAVVPYRLGIRNSDVDAGVFYRPDVVSLLTVPADAPQARTIAATARDANAIQIDQQSGCPMDLNGACRFSPDMRVALFDGAGAWDLLTVTAAGNGVIQFAHKGALSTVYPAGAAVARIVMSTYYLKPDAATGTLRLMRYDGGQSDLPLVDHVTAIEFAYLGDAAPPRLRTDGPPLAPPVATYGPSPPPITGDNPEDTWPEGENCSFSVANGVQGPRLATFGGGAGLVTLDPRVLQDGPWCPDAVTPNRFDADLSRIRRVRVTIRIEVASARLRGPAGVLFSNGGSATSARYLVPDQAVRFDVAPRNLNLHR